MNRKFKIKQCRYCEKDFLPTAPSHHFCSDNCKGNGTAQRHCKRRYGLTLKDVEKMLEDQNHLCAICREEGFQMNDRVYHGLNVDHCHTTGTVRGMLCHNCNRALGLMKDDIERLKAAIKYLEGATTIPSGSTLK